MSKKKTKNSSVSNGSGSLDNNNSARHGSNSTLDDADYSVQHNESKPTVLSAGKGGAGILYIIATPIGNASDISLRALDILGQVSVLACEDTRVTSKLLARHSLKIPLITYHEHNGQAQRPAIIRRLKNGENVALVSDAGTPLVSDPGYKLVKECAEQDLEVITIPGASAVMAALVLSGLPTHRFMFVGFMPPKSGQRRKELEGLMAIPATLVFMESPHRLPASLVDMRDVLGERDASVSREITKMYEETRRGTLVELAAHYAQAGSPKGEIMIVIAPPEKSKAVDESALDELLIEALKNSSLRDAVAEITQTTGLNRTVVYKRALKLSKG